MTPAWPLFLAGPKDRLQGRCEAPDPERAFAAERLGAATILNDLAQAGYLSGDCAAAERDWREARRVNSTLAHGGGGDRLGSG